MKRLLLPLLAAALAASLARAASSGSDRRRSSSAAAATPAPAVSPANSFEAFQLIVERNIFNPTRVGRTRASGDDKPARVDEISLVGTMQSDAGHLAFFDSPETAFRKALHEGESVADFKVVKIAADGVELLREDKPVSLKVSQQLRRPDGGTWSVRNSPNATPPPAATGRPGETATGLSRPGEPAAPEIPADASEVLKRLLKKREKQLTK